MPPVTGRIRRSPIRRALETLDQVLSRLERRGMTAIDALAQAERDGRLREKIRFYARSSPPIIDEIGCLPVTSGGANVRLAILPLEGPHFLLTLPARQRALRAGG